MEPKACFHQVKRGAGKRKEKYTLNPSPSSLSSGENSMAAKVMKVRSLPLLKLPFFVREFSVTCSFSQEKRISRCLRKKLFYTYSLGNKSRLEASSKSSVSRESGVWFPAHQSWGDSVELFASVRRKSKWNIFLYRQKHNVSYHEIQPPLLLAKIHAGIEGSESTWRLRCPMTPLSEWLRLAQETGKIQARLWRDFCKISFLLECCAVWTVFYTSNFWY